MAFSSFVALLLVAWYAITEVTLAGARSRARGLALAGRDAALAAAAVLVALALTIGLGMVRLGTAGNLYYKPNAHLAKGPLLFAILSFGPPLVLGLAGLLVVLRQRTLAIGLVIMTVDLRRLSAAGRDARTSEQLRAVSHGTDAVRGVAISTAMLIDALSASRGHDKSTRVDGDCVVLAVGGMPTMALDWYNARDIWNDRDTGFGFRWTTYVSDDEVRAARWLRRNVDVAIP